MNQTDHGNLFFSTGGLMIAGAAVALVAGTINLGGFIAALFAAYVVLLMVNSLDRHRKR